MFMDKSQETFNELKSLAETLINSKHTMDADKYELSLISLIQGIERANICCQLYEEELAWFTDRFGIAIIWIPWM
jgi:predicted 3-demethylubiquinone-9 3-methyltransferase (glyoxalase superfamily)